MIGPFITALLLAIGGGTWVYSQLQQRTGYGNSRNAVTGAAISALIIFLITYVTARLLGL